MLDNARHAAADNLRTALARIPNESMRDEVARLNRALALIDQQPAALWLEELRYAVLTLRDSYDYTSVAYPATTWDVVGTAMALRERIMQRHIARLLETLPDPRLVLMAHNAHLAKDDRRIHAPGTVGPGGDRERAVGTWLHERLNGDVCSVWMLFERGEDNQPMPDLPRKLRSPRHSLNAKLARVADVFALRTHSDDAAPAPSPPPPTYPCSTTPSSTSPPQSKRTSSSSSAKSPPSASIHDHTTNTKGRPKARPAGITPMPRSPSHRVSLTARTRTPRDPQRLYENSPCPRTHAQGRPPTRSLRP